MKARAARHQGILEVADTHQFALVKIISKAYSIYLNNWGICGLKFYTSAMRNTVEICYFRNYSNLYLYSTTTINQLYISQWGEGMLLSMGFFYIAYYHLGLCCSTSLSSKLHSVIFTLLPINGYFADAQENSCSEQKLHSVWKRLIPAFEHTVPAFIDANLCMSFDLGLQLISLQPAL